MYFVFHVLGGGSIVIRVRVYGSLRDLLGKPFVDVDAREGTLKEIFSMVYLVDGRTLYDFISDGDNIKRPYRVFIDGKLVESTGGLRIRVGDGAEIVVTPPVSAGSGMVDISGKDMIFREAEAKGRIKLKPETVKLIREGKVEKGDVFEAAKIAAINAVKSTPNILPYCHPISITHVGFGMNIYHEYIEVVVNVKAYERTGVEMEALTGVAAALLTIWDMVKKYEKDSNGNYPHTAIHDIIVVRKIKRGAD